MVKYAMPKLVGTPGSHVFPILDSIRQDARDAESIVVIAGYFKQSGWNLLEKEMSAALSRKCLVRVFSDSDFFNTDYSLLFGLNKDLNEGGRNFYGNVFDADRIKMLHAKVLVFDKLRGRSVVIASSANVTGPALCSNLELGIRIETQRTSELYKNVSGVVEFLQGNSREPTKKEADRYGRFRKQMKDLERKRRHLGGQMSPRTKRPASENLGRKSGNGEGWAHVDPKMITKIQRLSKRTIADDKGEAGKAVREIAKLVLAHEDVFSRQNNFKLLLRIYANILLYNGDDSKPCLKKLLNDDLQLIVKAPVERIYEDSRRGRYAGLTRNISVKSPISRPHIKATLDLIRRFYYGSDYEALVGAFKTFNRKTKKMKPRPIAFVTGILEALKPDLFVVCNARTRLMGKKIGQGPHGRILRSGSFEDYPGFNEAFRRIAERAGITDMRKIDLVANHWWWRRHR